MPRYLSAPSPTHVRPGASNTAAGADDLVAASDEDLAPLRVDHRERVGGSGGESVERRDSRTGISSASARPLAAARPMRTPVKLPGPVPTTSASTSLGSDRCGEAERRCPRARESEPSRPRRSLRRLGRAPSSQRRSPCRKQRARPRCSTVGGLRALRRRRDLTRRSIRPRDQEDVARGAGRTPAPASGHSTNDDSVVEVGLEVAPLGVQTLGEAVEVEVRDVDAVAAITVADRVRRARHRLGRRRGRARRRGRTSSCRRRARPRR